MRRPRPSTEKPNGKPTRIIGIQRTLVAASRQQLLMRHVVGILLKQITGLAAHRPYYPYESVPSTPVAVPVVPVRTRVVSMIVAVVVGTGLDVAASDPRRERCQNKELLDEFHNSIPSTSRAALSGKPAVRERVGGDLRCVID
jgi:hypothetical protein